MRDCSKIPECPNEELDQKLAMLAPVSTAHGVVGGGLPGTGLWRPYRKIPVE